MNHGPIIKSDAWGPVPASDKIQGLQMVLGVSLTHKYQKKVLCGVSAISNMSKLFGCV